MEQKQNTDIVRGPSSTKMKEADLLYHTRSEEVQEIMGRMPSWIIRWGITAIGIILVGLFVGAAFVKYPEIIPVKISIQAYRPPVKIIAGSDSRIEKLLVKDGDKINKGQVLAILQNASEYKSIFFLKNVACIIDTCISISNTLSSLHISRQENLGELQDVYTDLLIAINNYQKYNKVNSIQSFQLEQQLRAKAKAVLLEIGQWSQKYLVVSPSEGMVSFIKKLDEHTFVKARESILAIVQPVDNGFNISGAIGVNAANKIKQGQVMLIKLNAFPFQEYGMLKVQIEKISAIPIDGEYSLQLKPPQNLITTNNSLIPCQSELTGIGEISVSNKTILQHILGKLIASK